MYMKQCLVDIVMRTALIAALSAGRVDGAVNGGACASVQSTTGALTNGPVPGWEVPLRRDLEAMATRLAGTLKPWTVPDCTVRVQDHGAIGDGVTVNTKALQKAIDACAAQGGGVVLFSKGDFVTGTLDLRSGVMIEVAGGARILGSTRLADYPERIARRRTVMDTNMGMNQSLFFAEGCERIGFRGRGVIDGRGTKQNFPGEQTVVSTPGRPFLIRVLDSRNILLDGITLKDSPCWMQNYLNCEDLIFQGITVENQANWNNDGLDIDGCRNVIVRDCFLNSEDDALCFKGASLKPTENVLVENCRIYSTCNAIKYGTDSQGDFRNVLIRNVEAGGPAPTMRALTPRLAISGIALEIVDGGTLENVMLSGIRLVRCESPVFLRLGDRGRVMPGMPRQAPGVLRRVILDHLTGDANGKRGSIISGIPAASISDVVMRNFHLVVAGGVGAWPPGKLIPEKIDAYPDGWMFGPLVPSHGFWIRHARDVTFSGGRVVTEKPDARPVLATGVNVTNISW
jgi:hypothetical protein